MPLIIPNLGGIFKDDPKTGEALQKIQTYANHAAPIVAGNAIVAQSPTTTPPPSQQTTSPNTGSNPKQIPPPRTSTPRPDQT
ncbi:MAG TPA: hypothetical protein VHV32_19385 [Candidatus Angelobacter sp.]|nr:hypothetical protein [Candidatus Angelobacter sp.]